MILNRLVSTLELSQEEWLSYRRQGIGGSDAASVCGLNPYGSPMSVYMAKTNDDFTVPDNEAMRVGRDLEEYVAQRFCEATGKKVRRANAIFYHADYPHLIANVDRLVVGENAGLECKTCSAYSADKWKDGKVPIWYEIQCHHYMAVTGADAWYIACVILGVGFTWKKIERDEDLIRDLFTIENRFWNKNILEHQIPEPDGSESADELIKERYKKSVDGQMIALPSKFEESLRRRYEVAELLDKLETEKKRIDQEIKLVLKDSEQGYIGKYRVKWKSYESNRVDTKKLKEKYPEAHKNCLKVSQTRKFEVKMEE